MIKDKVEFTWKEAAQLQAADEEVVFVANIFGYLSPIASRTSELGLPTRCRAQSPAETISAGVNASGGRSSSGNSAGQSSTRRPQLALCVGQRGEPHGRKPVCARSLNETLPPLPLFFRPVLPPKNWRSITRR